MASIVKRQSRGRAVYQAKIRTAAGSTSATFDKLTDAKRWASETETKLRRGVYFEEQPAQKYNLSDLVDRYLGSPGFEKITEQATRRAHLEWWRGQLGTLALAKVTPEKISAERDELRKSGKAPATCNRYMAALSKALRLAVKLGWLQANPCSPVDKFVENNTRDRMLTAVEFQKLLDACRSQDLRDLIVLGRYTAARRGELTGLRRENVDLERGLVHFTDTKNGDSRGVALVGPALDVMKRRIAVPRLDTNLVFPRQRDPRKPAEMREAFKAAVKRAGLDGFLFHSLRHTCLTELAKAGATLSELRAIAGHRSMEMVMRYQHLCEDSTRSILERMAERSL